MLTVLHAQLPMRVHPDQNLVELDDALARGAAQGGDLVVCPELSITGFHRGVPALCDAPALARWLEQARALCARHRIGAAVGSPWPTDAGGWFNRMWVIDSAGHVVHRQDKVGLTPSEARWFTPGPRTTAGDVGSTRVAIVMCREILDTERVESTAADADLILWPGYIGWSAPAGEGADYLEAAGTLATALSAVVIQANWAEALNAPVVGMGGSVVIDRSGRLAARLPFDAPALGRAPVAPA